MISPNTATHPNKVAEELTGRDYVSFSGVALYRRCPLAYRFKYVDGLPEDVVSSSLVFGAGVHAAVELWFNAQMSGEPAPNQDELLAEFWDTWRCKQEEATVALNKNEDSTTISHMAERVLQAFHESEFRQPQGRILGVEEQLRGELLPGVPDLLARVDLIVENDEALTITDLKTARSRWSAAQAEDQAEQLLLYSELARHLVPGKQVRLEFLVISKAVNPVVERWPVGLDEQRIDRTKQIVRHVWRAIEAEHFYPAPSPINCPSCPFREPCREWTG